MINLNRSDYQSAASRRCSSCRAKGLVRRLLVPIAVLASLFAGSVHAQVTLFPECNFLGAPVSLPDGDYTQADLARAGIRNDSISSLVVAEGYEIVVYRNDNYRGRSKSYKSVTTCLSNDDLDDSISSVRVINTEQPRLIQAPRQQIDGDNYVEVFTECNHRGRSVKIAPGEYTTQQLRELGIPDNSISSIKTPKGMSITMYEHDFHRGRSGKLAADSKCLVERFNDKVSSVTVNGEAESSKVVKDAGVAPVTLFTACNFRGRWAELPAGEFSAETLKAYGIDDNSIASIKVPAGSRVVLYEHDFQRGRSVAYQRNVACLEGTAFSGATSSVMVEADKGSARRISGPDSVVLYTECGFKGQSAVVEPGEYPSGALRELGLPDNSISSIQIPTGFEVEIFEHDFYRGGSLKMDSSDDCLDDRNADDLISSVIVSGQKSGGVTKLNRQPQPAALSAAQKKQVREGLECVGGYVNKNLCTSDAWDVIKSFCALEGVPLVDDGYLEGHVKQGNCTQRNWNELVRRIADPSLR